MHKKAVLIFIIVAIISNVYAQKRECNNFETAAYSGKGNVDTKKLRESFEQFEELVKKQKYR